jgi:hypothetical protein
MRKLIFAAAFILLLVKTQAQQNTVSLSFQMSLPVGDYKNTYPKTGTGFLLSYIHRLPLLPSAGIGGEIGFLQMNATDGRYEGAYRNEYHTYIVSASNYIFTIAPKLRIELYTIKKTGKLFIDCSIGANIFFSYAAISHNGSYDILTNTYKDIRDSSSSSGYLVLRAGIGTGMELPLGKKKKRYLLLKGSYIYGGKAKYFSHPTIDQLQIRLEPKESKTCMLLAELGLRFNIGSKK